MKKKERKKEEKGFVIHETKEKNERGKPCCENDHSNHPIRDRLTLGLERMVLDGNNIVVVQCGPHILQVGLAKKKRKGKPNPLSARPKQSRKQAVPDSPASYLKSPVQSQCYRIPCFHPSHAEQRGGNPHTWVVEEERPIEISALRPLSFKSSPIKVIFLLNPLSHELDIRAREVL